MAFDLIGRLQLIDQMTDPLKRAAGAVNGLGSSAEKGNSGLGSLVGTIGRVATALGVLKLASDSVNEAINFDDAITGIGAISKEAKARRGEIEALSNQLGRDTAYSSLEAATAFGELVRAGRTVDNVLSGDLSAALDVAAADGMGLADAAIIMSDNMNAFGKSGITATEAANILAGTSAAASTDVAGLAMGLKMSAAVAATVGMSMSDAAAALGLLSNAGIKGSDAGTSLKSMLLNLQPATKAQTKLMKKLGLMTKKGSNQFFDASGNMKPLSEIAGLLNESMKDLTSQQRLKAMETLFGTDAIRAASVLFEAGAEGVDAFNEAMGQTTAQEMAQEKLASTAGKLRILSGSLSLVKQKIGEQALPYINMFADAATTAANNVTAWIDSTEGKDFFAGLRAGIDAFLKSMKSLWGWMQEQFGPLVTAIQRDLGKIVAALREWLQSQQAKDWFEAIKGAVEGAIKAVTDLYNWISEHYEELTPIIAGVAGAFAAFKVIEVVSKIQALADAIGGAKAALALLNLTMLANPAFWWALAIGAVIAVGVLLWQNWDEVKAKLIEIWQAISDKASEIWNGITEFFSGLDFSTILSGLALSFQNGFMGMWATIIALFPEQWQACVDYLQSIDLFQIGSDIIAGLWNGLKSKWSELWDWWAGVSNDLALQIKNALHIGSPSRVMREIGGYTIQGLYLGMEDEAPKLDATAVRLAEIPVTAVSTKAAAMEAAAPAIPTAPAASTASNKTTRPVSLTMHVNINGVGGNLREAATELVGYIAELLNTDGTLVAEGE